MRRQRLLWTLEHTTGRRTGKAAVFRRPAARAAVATALGIGAFVTVNGLSRRTTSGRRFISCDAKSSEDDDQEKPQESGWLDSFRGLRRRGVPTLDQIKDFELSDITGSEKVKELKTRYHDIVKIYHEFERGEDSLYRQILDEASDPTLHAEIQWDAVVRTGQELASSERAFVRNRKKAMKESFAKYLGIPSADVDEQDIPTIGLAGSGGGYRAMLVTLGGLQAFKRNGIFDISTYLAGVSGSCWTIFLYYTSLSGQSFDAIHDHLRLRVSQHFLNLPKTFDLLTSPPYNKMLLSGIIRKVALDQGDLNLVDVYGTLLSSRILIKPADPSHSQGDHSDGELGEVEPKVDPEILDIWRQRSIVEEGQSPMPIYTAVTHQIPETESADEKKNGETMPKRGGDDVKKDHYCWYELTPWEVGSEELGAWVPTWALGRTFEAGRSQLAKKKVPQREPEDNSSPDQESSAVAVEKMDHYAPSISSTIFLGIFGSAFCATVSHYVKEVQPFLPSGGVSNWVTALANQYQDTLASQHPLPPALLPNYVKGMTGLAESAPSDIAKNDQLGFMDAGIGLQNLPYFPLLREERKVDIILVLDASSEIAQGPEKYPFFDQARQYAKSKGIQGWPMDAGWPKSSRPDERDSRSCEEKGAEGPDARGEDGAMDTEKYTLGPCTIWVGDVSNSGGEKDDCPNQAEHSDRRREDGIAIAYFPMIPHPEVDNGWDPDPQAKNNFTSTFNFEYRPSETDKLVELMRRNVHAGDDQVKELVRAVWQRKKEKRLG